MPKKSAGLLLYRRRGAGAGWELLLVHPGGPFWRNKDDGAWTIPKGEFTEDEDPLDAAKREFAEETGAVAPADGFIELKPVKQASNKIVYAWAIEADFDPAKLRSNTFAHEWPPKSGRTQEFPEIDRAGWFAPEIAKRKILAGQVPLINELISHLQQLF